jgi:hypothetical protein
MSAHPPKVTLGGVTRNGISPSLYGLIERGARKRPLAARALRGTVEIHFEEDFAAVRVEFGDGGIVVGDAQAMAGDEPPDLVITGSLPDIVQVSSAPQVAGLPKPTDARGRAALLRVANRRVRMEGDRRLARRLLKLMEL